MMRDRFLAYALAASVGVHLIILCVVGRTSAARPIEIDDLKLVKVDVVKLPDVPKSANVNNTPKPAPKPTQSEPDHVSIPEPEKIPVAPPPKPRPVQAQAISKPLPTFHPNAPTQVASSKLPGNPGGALNLGSSSAHGEDLGSSGRTPVGWVPGPSEGHGAGSGSGEGVGRPEPVKNAVEGPGKEPAPVIYVNVKICTESGMLPGPNCESTATKTFVAGGEPTSTCNVCRPRHVSTLADRSVPELVSGRKLPKYLEYARDNGIQCSVTLEFTINTEGRVVDVRVAASSGDSELDRSAVDAVKSRRYKPAVQAGIPRDYTTRQTFRSSLD